MNGRLEREPDSLILRAHPAVLAAARTVLPAGSQLTPAGPVGLIREADGLEPILRLAALWQRVDEVPLRQTQQGTLYKRDRERLEDDPVLAGPMSDGLEPLPDMAALWLALGCGVGLIVSDPGGDGDRVVAARPEYWAEHAIHLPQMVATRWLGLRQWHEQGGMLQEGSNADLALPYLRPAVLLWLATLGPEDWVALDDLASHLRQLAPRWDRMALGDELSRRQLVTAFGVAGAVGAGRRGQARFRLVDRARGIGYRYPRVAAARCGLPAWPRPGGRGVRQPGVGGPASLRPLGRYFLALGPPPPPRPSFEHFLFVQPNFEIIAYRQGLNPMLIGAHSASVCKC